jgi:hypothetical protein
MTPPRTAVIGAILVGLVVAGCGSTPGPSGAARSARPDAAGASEPAQVVVDQLGGPWRTSPIALDDGHTAIISDACAAAAREKFGETEANLPTALVDARGEHLAIAILADDLDAIQCFARLDDTATAATVDGVQRLSMTAVAPVEGTEMSVASVVHDHDPALPRTVAFGRIGPAVDSAKVGFDDGSVVRASDAEGWWALWWPSHVRASSYSAVDDADLVVGSVKPFDGERSAWVGPASWWLDPAAPPPTPTSTKIRALIQEQTCSSGQSPEGRIEPPEIELTDAAVTVSFEVRTRAGSQDCQGVAPFAITIDLPEPLGARALFDGGDTPPRDATKPPG